MSERNAAINAAIDLVDAKADAWNAAGEMIPQGTKPMGDISRHVHFQIADALRAVAYDLGTLKESCLSGFNMQTR